MCLPVQLQVGKYLPTEGSLNLEPFDVTFDKESPSSCCVCRHYRMTYKNEVGLFIYIYIFIYIYVCMYVCMCVYKVYVRFASMVDVRMLICACIYLPVITMSWTWSSINRNIRHVLLVFILYCNCWYWRDVYIWCIDWDTSVLVNV